MVQAWSSNYTIIMQYQTFSASPAPSLSMAPLFRSLSGGLKVMLPSFSTARGTVTITYTRSHYQWSMQSLYNNEFLYRYTYEISLYSSFTRKNFGLCNLTKVISRVGHFKDSYLYTQKVNNNYVHIVIGYCHQLCNP